MKKKVGISLCYISSFALVTSHACLCLAKQLIVHWLTKGIHTLALTSYGNVVNIKITLVKN